jgi:hypothetical protein
MAIGPNIGMELLTAGLPVGSVLIIDFVNGVVNGREKLTPAQQIKFDQVLAAHDPTIPAPQDDPNKMNNLLLKVILNHENRIRALEGKPAITRAQLITALKAL